MPEMHSDADASDFLIIPEHKPLSEARKDIIYGTAEPFRDDRETFSEWAVVAAFCSYQVGQQVSWSEFEKTLIEAQTQQGLDELVALGLMEALWDEKEQATVYRIKNGTQIQTET